MKTILDTDDRELLRTNTTETLEQFFERSDSPAKNSPTGAVMQKLALKRPELSWEQSREVAKSLLQDCASKKRYAVPRVLSVAEIDAEKDRLKAIRAVRTLPVAA